MEYVLDAKSSFMKQHNLYIQYFMYLNVLFLFKYFTMLNFFKKNYILNKWY